KRNDPELLGAPAQIRVLAERYVAECGVEAIDAMKDLGSQEKIGSHETEALKSLIGNCAPVGVANATGNNETFQPDNAADTELLLGSFEPVRERLAIIVDESDNPAAGKFRSRISGETRPSHIGTKIENIERLTRIDIRPGCLALIDDYDFE